MKTDEVDLSEIDTQALADELVSRVVDRVAKARAEVVSMGEYYEKRRQEHENYTSQQAREAWQALRREQSWGFCCFMAAALGWAAFGAVCCWRASP